MNTIKINKQTFNVLSKYTYIKRNYGSKMKGTSDAFSDTDTLYILHNSLSWLASVYNTDHILLYKDVDGNDHMLVSLHCFLKSLVTGSSTLFHDMVRRRVFKGTIIRNLQACDFSHYPVLKGYLGMAYNDAKSARGLYNNRDEAYKKLSFAVDEYNYVAEILDEDPIKLFDNFDQTVSIIVDKIAILRKQVVQMMKDGRVPKMVSKEILTLISDITWAVDAAFDDYVCDYDTGLKYFEELYLSGN